MRDAGGPSIRTRWIVISERVIFASVIGIFGAMAWLWTHELPASLFLEHGLLENAQVAILVVCAIVLIPLIRIGHGVTRTISTIFMIAVITGIVREAEVKSFHGPDWWNWLTHKFSLQEILLFRGLYCSGCLRVDAPKPRCGDHPKIAASICNPSTTRGCASIHRRLCDRETHTPRGFF